MIFPITDLLSEQQCVEWIIQHFHPQGLRCPRCGASTDQARQFRSTSRGLIDYRCKNGCNTFYNLYTNTIFSGTNLRARQVVLLLRGVCKGESTKTLAAEIGLSRVSVHRWRKRLQENSYLMLDVEALNDTDTETDEMFQNAGEKKRKTQRSSRSASTSGKQAARAR
jgi:transposase-like protein